MHSFVATVMLRHTGFDEVGQDAEPNPPGGELRKACQGVGCEGHTGIGANAFW